MFFFQMVRKKFTRVCFEITFVTVIYSSWQFLSLPCMSNYMFTELFASFKLKFAFVARNHHLSMFLVLGWMYPDHYLSFWGRWGAVCRFWVLVQSFHQRCHDLSMNRAFVSIKLFSVSLPSTIFFIISNVFNKTLSVSFNLSFSRTAHLNFSNDSNF